MQEKDILETFKKHIGEMPQAHKFEIPLCKSHRINNFGEDIKSANELTGALQILQITFKKILALVDGFGENVVQDSLIEYQIQEKVDKCKFLGNALFDSTLSAKVGQSTIEFENPSPMPLLSKGDKEGFVGYIEEKLLEITDSLQAITQAVANEKLFDKHQADTSFAGFDKNVFLAKMRG